jgi:hypothetical protein
MKRACSALLLLVLATLGSTAQAQAQAARTRAEVLAELAEARRMGDIVISGCGGGTFREAFPNRYPPRSTAAPPPDAGPAPRSDDRMAGDTRRAAQPSRQ